MAVETKEKQSSQQLVLEQRKAADKWKRKKWFEVFASEQFDNRQIASTPAEKPELLIGRTVLVNAAELSGQGKKAHISLKFRIDDVRGGKAYAKAVGQEVNAGYIRRLVRRHISKIESTQYLTTKDGKKLKVKTLTISARKLNKGQETAIRKIMEFEIAEICKAHDADKLIHDFVFANIAQKIYAEEKKISNIKKVEVVNSELIEKASAAGQTQALKEISGKGETSKKHSDKKAGAPQAPEQAEDLEHNSLSEQNV